MPLAASSSAGSSARPLPLLPLLLLLSLVLLVYGLSPVGGQTCASVLPKCSSGGACADLTIDGTRVQSSAYVESSTWTSDSCAVVEGCTSPGQRTLLRFDMATPNIGSADMYLGNPGAPSNAPCFVWSSCHNHYHFAGSARGTSKGRVEEAPKTRVARSNGPSLIFLPLALLPPSSASYAAYALYQGSRLVATGSKRSSCLEDSMRWPGSTAPVMSVLNQCNTQGIHRSAVA